MNQKEFLEKIKTTVLAHDKNTEVILFGSRARGDHKPDSDWDLLILTKIDADAHFKRAIIDDVYDVELKYDQAISTVIISRENWEDWSIMPLYKTVAKEGIAI